MYAWTKLARVENCKKYSLTLVASVGDRELYQYYWVNNLTTGKRKETKITLSKLPHDLILNKNAAGICKWWSFCTPETWS